MNPLEFRTLSRAERELWWFRGMRRILFNLLDALPAPPPHSLVFEAGSGTGYMARQFARRYGWRVIATDLSPVAVSLASPEWRAETVQGDIASCPFRSATFDAVISLDVLVHFAPGDETRALAEFARTLKPGGLLILRVAALDILRSRHSEFVGERQRFTRPRLLRSIRAAGFRPLRCTYLNTLLLPVALLRFRVWEPLFGQTSSGTGPVPAWLNRLLHLPLRLEAFLLARGWNFPAGQSLLLLAVRDNSGPPR